VLLYLAIVKEFEPLLLLPIGFGGLLANMPFANVTAPPLVDAATKLVVEPGGFLYYFFEFGVSTGLFPIMIFMGVGAMTDFGPLIGSAGVSAVPMAARVSNKVGLESDPANYLLMHAMGPNVAGVIGSAVVAGVLYTLCK